MSNESKQGVALYLDKELVRNADIIKTKYGYKSRNDLYAKAIEAFIANEIIESLLATKESQCKSNTMKFISIVERSLTYEERVL